MPELTTRLYSLFSDLDFADPFNFEFSKEKTIENITDASKKELEYIEVATVINSYFEQLIGHTLKTLQTYNFSSQDLIDGFFAKSNTHLFSVSQDMLQAFVDDQMPGETDRLAFTKIKTESGSNDVPKDSIELVGDVLTLIMNYERSGKILSDYKPIDAPDRDKYNPVVGHEDDFFKCLQTIHYYFNLILNIQDVWDSILYAGVDVSLSKTRLDILPKDGLFPELQTVNEVRASNHFQEYFLPMMLVLREVRKKQYAPEGTVITSINVENSLVRIATGTGTLDLEDELFTDVRLSLANEYLADTPLPGFENCKLDSLYRLLYALKQIPSYMGERALEVNDLSKMPAKIREDQLLEYLKNMTGFSDALIRKFVDSICCPDAGEFDLWRTPLYRSGGDVIYMTFCVLQAPNFDLYTDRWVSLSGIYKKQLLTQWENYVRMRLTKSEERNKLARFKVLASGHIDRVPEHLVLLETDTFVLVLILVVYEFPLEDAAKKTLLSEISKQFSAMREQLAEVEGYAAAAGKKVLFAGLSNYVQFSGLALNDIPLLDLTLLINYIFTGKSEKIKAAPAGKRTKISTFYEFTYYRNQEEFEQNLPTFLKYPYPVHQLLSRMTFEERMITPDTIMTPIFIQAVTMVSIERETMSELYELDVNLKKEYFLETKKQDRSANERIFQFLSRLFAKINMSVDGSPDLIVEIVNAIKTSKSVTATHLLTYLVKYAFQLRAHQPVDQKGSFHTTPYEPEDIERIQQKVSKKLQFMSISFGTYTDELELDEADEIVFINFLIDYLSTMATGSYSIEQLGGYFQQIILFKGYYHKHPVKQHLYMALNNYIMLLNHNHYYDIARNIAYEATAFAILNNDRAEGWLMMFECYIKQKNTIYAGVYGGLLFTALDSDMPGNKQLILQSIYALMKHLREYGALEFILQVFKMAKKFRLSDYDNQRFTLVAFYTRFIHSGEAARLKVVPEIVTYLEKHVDAIKNYGTQGVAPWVNLLLNIVASAKRFDKPLPSRFMELLNELSDGDATGFDSTDLYELTFGFGESTNEKLAEAISQCFQARDFDDFSHQIINLETLAQHGLKYGQDNNDVLSFWLCSFILNDQLLSFKSIAGNEDNQPFGNLPTQWPVTDLLNYPQHLKSNLQLKDSQVLLWLTEVSGTVYSVLITHDQQISFAKHEYWNVQQMRYWLRNALPKFYFNSEKTAYYDYKEQDDIYDQLVQTLIGFDLNLPLNYQEILVLKSVDMAGFPDNLLINHKKLVGRDHAICNILNLEYFLANHEPVEIKELTMSAWIPRAGQDPTISYGYDALAGILAEQKAVIYEETIIADAINTSLNVFLAHGNVGRNGFSFIETGSLERIINYEMFGQGDIAIMFVCSSGSVKEDFFAQDVVSLCQDLIHQGYKAVVAPFWKYDVTMAQIWLREFLKVFKEGYSLNECVHLANRRTGDYDYETGKLFHDPAGWAAMHLYGNPNIYLNINI